MCVLIVFTCLQTGDYSYLLVCIIMLMSRNLSIHDFVKISYKTLAVLGEDTY